MANNPYPGQGYPGQTQQSYAPQPQPVPAQPSAPQAPPAQGGGGLGPPSGAAKMLYFGLVMMLVAFGVKQILVNLSLNSSGNLLEKPKLTAKMGVEIAEIDTALDEIDTEIEDAEADAPKPPKAKGDDPPDSDALEAFAEKSKKHEEKVGKLKKDRAKQDEDLEDKRKEVRKKYRPMIREAGRAETKAQASGLGNVQLTLLFKLILDFLKIGGAALCVLSGLSISANENEPMSVKVYAAVIGGIAFLAVVAGGVAALFG